MFSIRELKNHEIEAIMDIWKDSTIKAHDFISEEYWAKNYEIVKSVYIPIAETFIYEDEEGIKGFISIIEGEFIGALFVHSNHQGSGIGSKLIDYVFERYEKLGLAVYRENEMAVEFYKNKGFRMVKEQKNQDSGFSEYIMEKWKNCDFSRIPPELSNVIQAFHIDKVIEGRIGDSIIQLSNDEEALYLKKSGTDSTKAEMENEYKILKWLNGKNLSVPKVLYYGETGEASYMLISEVRGKSAHEIKEGFSKEEIVRICAEGLLEIHSIDTAYIPREFSNWLDIELDKIVHDVENDSIDIESFKGANDGRTPKEVMEYLLKNRNLFTSDVFTHGDYCLPNVMISREGDFGFVDWSQGGIGDIYRDISPVIKSIRRNFGEGYEGLFFQYYGIKESEVNFEKIDYYDLIDQFTYYKKGNQSS